MDEAYVLLVITKNQVQLWPFVTLKAAQEAVEFLREVAPQVAPEAAWRIISDHEDRE